MFRLQKIEITGFKSFADYTEIVFTENGGITAVVGPNGCGKSNVSDAIAWVLGEQSAKSLRGGEMQDVIFQGTKSRKPSGMSEVILHLVRDESVVDSSETDEIDEALADFDEHAQEFEEFPQAVNDAHAANGNGHHANGNGFHPETNGHAVNTLETAEAAVVTTTTVPKQAAKRKWRPRRASLDFAPGEAVSITRRLYRSGESEYSLNGRSCRLRDIQDLFAGTGLSGTHYALVQQERISQILSSKPSDRRALIEEAAGITKFRTRQRAAEIRLESAKTNLRRISDIVSEIERQANALRRQAGRTRRYKTMREEFRELLQQVFVCEGKELNARLENLREKLTTAFSDEQKTAESVAEQAEKSQSATQNARQAEEVLAEIRAQAAENALRRERVGRDLKHQSEQVKHLEERQAAVRFEIKAAEERLKTVSADVERLREKNQQSNVSNEAETAVLKSLEADFQQKQAEVRRVESEIEKLRTELLQHTAAAERLREISKQQANALERLKERAEGLEREATRAAQTHDERIKELENLNEKIAADRNELANLQKSRQTAQETVRAARESLQASEKALGKVRDEANGVRHRRETLEKLDSSNSLLAPAVQKLLAAREKLGVKLNGTLADALRVEAKFEKAVEAVLGAFLQSVLVESAEDARKIAEWFRANDLGQLNLLVCPQSATSRQSSENSNRIGELLNVSPEMSAILEATLPEQMNFRAIENLAAADDSENCVTIEGELVYKNRLFVYGSQQKSAKGGILSFKRELRELQKRGEELKIEFERADAEVKTLRENLQKEEKTVSELQSKQSQAEREIYSLEHAAKSLSGEIERAERHKRVVADERQRIEAEQKDVAAKRDKAETDSQTAETARVAASSKLTEVSAKLDAARKTAETASQALSEKRAAAAASEERRRSLAGALRRVENEKGELSARVQKLKNELNEAVSRLETLRRALAETSASAESFETEKETEAREIAEAARNLQAAREDADRFAAELNALNRRAAEAKDARSAFEVQQAEIVTELKNLHENCLHELNQPLENLSASSLFDDFDLPSGKQRVEELREKLEGFGAVNLLALEELAEAEERLLFLTSQRKDIVDSIAAAEEALQEIKRRSRERFEQAFAEINRNFTEFFTELFGGGRGEMNLLDAADVLESGIEIVAQPPGKRLQNLLLLSGGEKAMTAIALIMAIFRYRPAPFCLLDEVDAPLDEANVGRFVDKIAQMSQKTQFIVITHNKRTMESAGALYGVTMEEAGVSKVVSVKFE